MLKHQFMLLMIFSNIFLAGSSQAQQEKCATMDVLQEQISTEESALLQWQQVLSTIEHSIEENRQQRAAVITIPVVVHVVHDGEPYGVGRNIPDEQIYAQLESLNKDFRRLNSDTGNTPSMFKPFAADCEIEFCLANTAPNGNPTSGIIRMDGGRSSWTQNLVDSDLKPVTVWNADNYLNIWVLKLGGSSSGILGYAQFPAMGNSTDGIVIDYQAFGSGGSAVPPYHKGRTTTHEIGHWLGLFHIWGDDGGSCVGDDLISDTPNQGDSYSGCPSFPKTSCGSEDMFMNYMDYVNDNCSNIFTQGQKQRMIGVLNSLRASIKTSPGCSQSAPFVLDAGIDAIVEPSSDMCSGEFVPKFRLVNGGSQNLTSVTIQFSVDGGSPSIINWTGSLAYTERELIYLPIQNLGTGNHSISVSLLNPNSAPDQNSANDQETINFSVNGNTVGISLPFSEDFEGTFPPMLWQIDDPDGDRAWEQSTATSGYGSGTACALFDNFDKSFTIAGRRDGLITPELDFTGAGNPLLTFDVAYAGYNSSLFDSLILMYSTDCGETWHRRWKSGGSDLATAGDQTTSFIPGASEWKAIQLSLWQARGFGKVMLKFENISGWGNNLYVDNVNIISEPVGLLQTERTGFQLYPNPAHNTAIINGLGVSNTGKVSILTIDGKLLSTFELDAVDRLEIDLQDLPKGMYLVELITNESQHTQKLIIH